MPTIKRTVVLTDAAPQANPLAGSQYEFLPFNALLEFAILGDAGESIEAYVSSGSDILMENSPVDVLAVASPIIYPDHYGVRDVAAAGERIGLSVRKLTAGDAVCRVAVQITPL
jgi:hypothetical protein